MPWMSCFNGATAFRRWIRACFQQPYTRSYPLQWCHRLSAMDTTQAPTIRSGYGPRFNGATAFRRWILSINVSVEYELLASMGPPPFGDGYGQQGGRRCPVVGASMGPPPFGDGYRAGRGRIPGHLPPLQWGHRLSAMDTFPGVCEFPFLPRLQWGHRLSAMDSLQILLIVWREVPLQWGHRLSAMDTAWSKFMAQCIVCGFNGATAFRRWIHEDGTVTLSSEQPLQWGHRLSAMDTPSEAASMGPPPFGDRGHLPFMDRPKPLQWGHRLSAMDTEQGR